MSEALDTIGSLRANRSAPANSVPMFTIHHGGGSALLVRLAVGSIHLGWLFGWLPILRTLLEIGESDQPGDTQGHYDGNENQLAGGVCAHGLILPARQGWAELHLVT